jgi:hypothetical protein
VFRAEMYGARIIHGIGSPSELNQASTMSKMIAWRKANGLYPVPGSAGASSGDGAGDGATGDASAQ